MTNEADRPEPPEPPAPPAHADRSTRLLVGGVVLIVLGCIALLFALLSIGSVALLQQAPQVEGVDGVQPIDPLQALPGLAIYVAAGAILLTLGIGSLRRRRWVRPLVQILGWGWLAVGVATAYMLLNMLSVLRESLPPDPAAGPVVLGCVVAFFGIGWIVVPGGLLLLYSSRDVAATLATHDPEPRWTDRVPTPLLGLSLWLGLSAVGTVLSSVYGFVPMGEELLTGPAAVAFYLANGMLFAVIAIGLARRSRAAWWLGIAMIVGWGTWSVVVLPRVDFAEVMRRMGTPPQQPGMPDFAAMYQQPWFLGGMVAMWLALLAYFLFVRRYLRSAGEP